MTGLGWALLAAVLAVWALGLVGVLWAHYNAHTGTRASRDEWDAWLDLEVTE